MKNKYLVIIVALGLIAIIIINFANKSQADIDTGPPITSKAMEKSVAACKNAVIEIDGTTYKLNNEVASVEDTKGGAGLLVLKFANFASKGLIDSGPVNDLACVYELNSKEKGKTTYMSILLGFTNNQFANQGTIKLGDNLTMKGIRIDSNKVIVSYSDESGVPYIKTIFLDGDAVIFMRSVEINDRIIE